MNAAKDWLKFLRQYGPIAQNGNMFDEEITRTARRTGIRPITFNHPLTNRLFQIFDRYSNEWESIILTGTAGDGKTHLCRQIWERLDGSVEEWASDKPYVVTTFQHSNRGQLYVHVIRDLSAWVPQQGVEWPQDKVKLLLKFSKLLAIQRSKPRDFFLIAANDGQLVETWRRLVQYTRDEDVELALLIFEDLLLKDEEEASGLKFFNLSKIASARLFELALETLLSHERWKECLASETAVSATFGEKSPIRQNYQLLTNPLVQERLKTLFEFCDYNKLHVPIREILLLLANAILGHPDCPEGLMRPNDVEKIINEGSTARASLFNNIFGGNLTSACQESIPVFRYLNLLRIGYETTNRIDNILIFGETDKALCHYFDKLMGDDTFYGADQAYREACKRYIEGNEEDEKKNVEFLEDLVAKRRALFFKIPPDWEDGLKLWDLTVFKHVGAYRNKIIQPLKEERAVDPNIVRRLVKGLNRIWLGMLVESNQKLYLATGLSFSNVRVSRLLKDEVSVKQRFGQKIEVRWEKGESVPRIQVNLTPTVYRVFSLTLTRFEFLNQVADGALPNSFSKECYEDVMTFKSQVLTALAECYGADEEDDDTELTFRFLNIDEQGVPIDEPVEILNA